MAVPRFAPPIFEILATVIIISFVFSVGCGGGGSGTTPGPTPTPPGATPSPTPTPVTTAGVSIKVGDAQVPPGGIYQYQLLLTEPKPIGNGSARPTMPSGSTGTVRGVAVNDPSGQAVGIALVNQSVNPPSFAVSIKAPNLPNPTMGTDVSYPLFTMTMPVNSSATLGASLPVNLDASNTSFLDGNGALYPQEITGGTLSIGGTISITDVIPGGGLLPDRTTLRILGIGFTSNTRIQIEGTTIFFNAQDTRFISPNEIDVTLCNGTIDPAAISCPHSSPSPDGTGATFQLDGERVRATNKDTNEVKEYFSYQRTDDESGASGNSLVLEVHPMFSRILYSRGFIPYQADATHFTGMSVQNTSAQDATFNVELLDSGGNPLPNSAQGVVVRAGKKITRDIGDWVPVITGGTPVRVRVTVASGPAQLQMLGFTGDTVAGTVTPLVVSAQ